MSELPKDRFASATGIEMIEARPGYARARLPLGEKHLNAVGLIHGGAMFTLAASAFFAAANAAGNLALGISMSFTCVKAVATGILYAEAIEVARSRRLSTCEVRITDEHQQLVALFQGTAYVKAAGPTRADKSKKRASP